MPDYKPNPFQPGRVTDVFIPDQLVAGHLNLVTDTVLLTGAAALVRGTVLGEFATAATAVAAAGANTGNGVMGAIVAAGAVREGVYNLRIVRAVANAGDFQLRDPDGDIVGLGSVAVPFSQSGLAFTLADGAVDFVVGDSFSITVTALTSKAKLSLPAAGDGSQVGTCILVDDADPSAGDVQVGVYRMGEFNARALTLGAGHSLASIKAQLARRGIFIKSSVSAAAPT